MGSTDKIYFYPLWLRIWHGLNALCIITLIVTGLLMNSGGEANAIGFNLTVKIHNVAGILLSLAYLGYITGNLATANGRYYLINMKGFFKRPMKQAYYYFWGMFHGMEAPFPITEKRKFNPLQKYMYVLIMYLAVPVLIISGISLLFPEIIIEKVYHFSGISITAILHSAIGFFISIFLIIHIYFATIGKSPFENFKSMINGWHNVSH